MCPIGIQEYTRVARLRLLSFFETALDRFSKRDVRIVAIAGVIATLLLVRLGVLWPSPFTIAAILALPSSLIFLATAFRPALVAGRPNLQTYLWACLIGSVLCVSYQGIWMAVNRGDEETIIIPESYRGPVIIAYDSKPPAGRPREYEEGRRLYRIPGDGVLRTQLSDNAGWHKAPRLFQVTSEGLRPPLFDASGNWDRTPPGVVAAFGGDGGMRARANTGNAATT